MKVEFDRKTRIYTLEGACVNVRFIVVGMIQNNTYLIDDGTTLFVVDPSADAKAIIAAAGNRSIDTIVVTHHHHDHTGALKELRDATGARVVASEIDSAIIENQSPGQMGISAESCPVDVKVSDGDTVKIGSMKWKVISTPGHTPGGICLFLDADTTDRLGDASILISGDTLFCGSIGRTDFEGGNMGQMKKSLRRLSNLPDDTVVLPGHNNLTTIQAEQSRVFAFYC